MSEVTTEESATREGVTQLERDEHVVDVHSRLLKASGLLRKDGSVVLEPKDIATALSDMHLQREAPPGVVHPNTFLPASLYAAESVDMTDFVRRTFPEILAAHPVFLFMAEQVVGNDDWFESVYFGTVPRDASSLDFSALCRRLVASVYLFELLLALDRDQHRMIAQWYEALYANAKTSATNSGSRSESARETFLGFFLELKGESVLASINTFERMRRLRPEDAQFEQQLLALGRMQNTIMGLNIFEAIISNLSFAFWPDNARAGLALLLAQSGRGLGEFRQDLSQDLDKDWFDLYLAWNANFIWPSHYFSDMMAFTMLSTPTISLGGPSNFQYNRAHSLFWVVRSNQLTRLLRQEDTEAGESPCFHCRQLEPASDRQPLTSRTAVQTRAFGERVAASFGEDVSDESNVWWRLAFELFPKQLRNAFDLYQNMPRKSSTKLDLL